MNNPTTFPDDDENELSFIDKQFYDAYDGLATFGTSEDMPDFDEMSDSDE